MGGAEGQLEKPMEYQEMRRRVPRRSSMEYYNRTPSSNSLGAMTNAVDAVEKSNRQEEREQRQKGKKKQKEPKQKQQSCRRRSSRASRSSRRSESSDDSAYVSHPLKQQQQQQERSQTPPPSDTRNPIKQRRRASRRASAEDGLIPVKKDSLKDIIARRPSGSALDTEGTGKRKQALEQFGTLHSSSTIDKGNDDGSSRRSSAGSISISSSSSSRSSSSTRSDVSNMQHGEKSKKDRSPSSIISAEAQLTADVCRPTHFINLIATSRLIYQSRNLCAPYQAVAVESERLPQSKRSH